MSAADEATELLEQFGIESRGDLASCSPIDGSEIGRAAIGDPGGAAEEAARAFLQWRAFPRHDAAS